MRVLLGFLFGLAWLATPALATEPPGCRSVRLAQNGWSDVAAGTALAAELYRALGYQPRISTLSVPAIHAGMRNGQVDAFLGGWPSLADQRQPYLDDHSLTLLGPNLTGARIGLAVPAYLRDDGLRDMADLARYADRLNRRILAIEAGSASNARLEEVVRRNGFGLGAFQVTAQAQAALLASVQAAEKARQPVVFLAWEPHWLNRDLQPVYLAGADAVFGPDAGAVDVSTEARTAWLDTCPNAARLLRNLRFSADGIGAMMGALRVQGRAPERAASGWLRDNPGVLAGWLDGVMAWDGKGGIEAARARLGVKP